MAYPATIETLNTSHADDVGEEILAQTDNDQARVLNAIMNELGANPSEGWATVAARLDMLIKFADTRNNGDSLIFDSGEGRFKPGTPASVPVGSMFEFAGSAAPTGYLVCDGSLVSRTTYAGLYAVIGFAYSPTPGTDPGSNSFYLPDFRGRVAVGKGTHADIDALGENDGITTVGNRRPKHKHTLNWNDPGHTHSESGTGGQTSGQAGGGIPSGGGAATTGSSTTGITASVGPQTGAEPTDGPAYVVVNKIIKY
jgi:microcystin-dependent protein